MILHTGEDPQLTFYGNAPRMRQLDNLSGQGNVVLERQAGAVDHDGGVTAIHSRDTGINGLAVIQMQGNGNGAVLGVLLNSLGDIIGAHLFIFQGAVCKIGTAAHKGVGQIRALDNGSGTEHLMNLNDGLGLRHGIDIERPLGVVILFGSLQNGSHRYQRHTLYPPFIFLLFFRKCRFLKQLLSRPAGQSWPHIPGESLPAAAYPAMQPEYGSSWAAAFPSARR